YRAQGYERLQDVPAAQLQGLSGLVLLSRRAVYCTAGAELAERFRSYDATAAGNQRADDLTPSIDEYRRDARYAIRDLLGIGHTTVELTRWTSSAPTRATPAPRSAGGATAARQAWSSRCWRPTPGWPAWGRSCRSEPR